MHSEQELMEIYLSVQERKYFKLATEKACKQRNWSKNNPKNQNRKNP